MNIKELWNSQADHQNQWDSLGEDEKLEFAMAHEREECAKLCLSIWNKWLDTPEEDRYKVLYDAEDCAEAIRARSKA